MKPFYHFSSLLCRIVLVQLIFSGSVQSAVKKRKKKKKKKKKKITGGHFGRSVGRSENIRMRKEE